MPAGLFHGGRPTNTDVDALVRFILTKEEGEDLTHGELAAVIRETPKSQRAKTVLNKARLVLRTVHNRLLVSVHGIGYRIASPGARMSWATGQASQGARKIRRAVSVAATTDPERLTQSERTQHAHFQVVGAKLAALEITAAKKLP